MRVRRLCADPLALLRLSLPDARNRPALRPFAGGAVSLIATRLRLALEGRKWPTSGSKRLPLGQRSRALDLVSFTSDEVTLRVKMIVKRGVDGNEFL